MGNILYDNVLKGKAENFVKYLYEILCRKRNKIKQLRDTLQIISIFFSINACIQNQKILILHHNSPVQYAKVAQLVERNLAKVEVAGSNPVFRSA
jgi:hypothetical protein